MKLSKVSLGVAAACGLLAGLPAHALLASAYTNTSETAGTTFNVRSSGATAQDPGLLTSTLRNCTAGSMTRYSISNNFVYFCTATPAMAAITGKAQLAVYKYSVGGSDAGVSLVNSGSTLVPFLDLNEIKSTAPVLCTASASSTVDPDGTGVLSSFQDITCSGASTGFTTPVLSYIGISDVEPQFFGPPSTYTNLVAEPLASVIFGLPVTKNIYAKLQAAQGITVPACGPTGLEEACMPTLSQAQVTSMFTQTGQDWDALTGTTGGGQVYVARRANTSGTQKSYEAVIARTGNGTLGGRECQAPVDPFVSGPDAIDNTAVTALCTAANFVVNNSGSGQVVACLNAHQAGNRSAIGTLTTELKASGNVSPVTGTNWAFVKINGFAPTHANVAKGIYTQYADASLNERVNVNPTAAQPGYTGYINKLKADFADPAVIAVINAGNQVFGPSGLMSLDVLDPVTFATPDFTGASGRNPWSRLVGGTDVNNCQPGKQATF